MTKPSRIPNGVREGFVVGSEAIKAMRAIFAAAQSAKESCAVMVEQE